MDSQVLSSLNILYKHLFSSFQKIHLFVVSMEADDPYLVSGLFSARKNTAHLLFLKLQEV